MSGGLEYEWEVVNSIPVKRIYDPYAKRVNQVPIFPKEFKLANVEILFKVKFLAMNYPRDVSLIRKPIVPGNKIIGRVYTHSPDYIFAEKFKSPKQKYLVFPYTNCIQQGLDQCQSCQKILKHNCFIPCDKNLEFGLTLDGGLQDYMILKHPQNSLIPIPPTTSTHDAALSLDMVFPLWLCIKSLFFNKIPFFMEHKLLVIVNSLRQDLNDVLIVCRLLHLDRSLVTILDPSTIEQMPSDQQTYYKSQFKHAFLFNFTQSSIDFAFKSVVSTGLESTKSRYNVVFFDQYNPASLASFPLLQKTITDKTVIQFRPYWYHQPDFIELLDRLGDLNGTKRGERPSISSGETICSSLSSNNSISTSTSRRPYPKEEETDKKPAWLWYDRDYNLLEEGATRRINKHIDDNTRVCYVNKTKSYKIKNAVICV